jgi:hypothetical protein
MSLESILSSLSPSEKVAAFNFLWRELSANSADFPSPQWHGDVLADRLANPSDESRLSIEAAIDDVKERLNARRTER